MSKEADINASYADRMAAEHADDDGTQVNPLALEAPPENDDSLVRTSAVSFARYNGYLAQPAALADDQLLPCLIVIHEWWGLNPQIKGVARQLALQGYRALAVDLYGKPATSEVKTARKYMKECFKVKDEYCMDCLKQAVEYLQRQQSSLKIGVVGWCLGGMFSLQLALSMPSAIQACVVYYGNLETDLEKLKLLETPVLGIFGGADRGIPLDSVRAFETALETLDKHHEIHVYPEADHAFCNPSGNHYQEKEARDAWNKMLVFLSTYLKDE